MTEVFSRVQRKITYLKDRSILKENLRLKSAHKGKRAFIIGNGKSIKNENLIKFSNEQTFVANSFFRHEQYDALHPKFYVIMDSEHFKGHEESLKFFNELEKKLHSDTIVFLPLKAKSFIEKHGFLKKNQVHYIYIKGDFKEKGANSIAINKTIPSTMGVGLTCLIIAEYMGFSPIYLLGFDHDWLAQPVKEPIQRFYSGHIFNDDKNDTYEYRMWCQYVLFKNYRLLKKAMRADVVNLTPSSFLDVFPFKTLNEILP